MIEEHVGSDVANGNIDKEFRQAHASQIVLHLELECIDVVCETKHAKDNQVDRVHESPQENHGEKSHEKHKEIEKIRLLNLKWMEISHKLTKPTK